MSEALFLWFTQQTEKDAPVTVPLLQELLLIFYKVFNEGGSHFTFSICWIECQEKCDIR
jgi:hypothetical protein